MKRLVVAVLFLSITAYAQAGDEDIIKDLDFFMKLDVIKSKELLQTINMLNGSGKPLTPQPSKEAQNEK